MEECQALHLFPGEEQLHDGPSEAPHQPEHQNTARRGAQQAQKRAQHCAEGVAAADLQRLAGDQSYQHHAGD